MKDDNTQKIEMLTKRKEQLKKDLQRIRFEGVESMTRKQIEEVEKEVILAEVKFERAKDKLERINLVSAKAGIEHLCEKLEYVRVETGI